MQTVDYDAIKRNVAYFKGIIGKSKLCAVVKNNAYGHGVVNVARHIARYIDFFAVGSVDEAEKICFLNKNILILLPQNERNVVRAIQAGCVLTLDSFDTLNTIQKVTCKRNLRARVHIKIDSGMSRLGFSLQQLDSLCEALQGVKINVEGIFSHFYGDSEAECDIQYEYFERCCAQLESKLAQPLIKHISNTSATLLSTKYYMDMVRIGLGLYGYGSTKLTPAKKVFANVIAVNKVEAGSAVGYEAKYRSSKATQIAVLEVGYATGLPRTLVGANIQIGQQRFEIVAICMAMTLVDIGDADVRVGDEAILLSKKVNTSNDEVIIYELLCNLQ